MTRPKKVALPGVIVRNAMGQMTPASQLRQFDLELEKERPSFAGLLGKLYVIAAHVTAELDNPELSTKDKATVLNQMAKTLPLLQEAEKNHKTAIKDKTVENMSNAELIAFVAPLLAQHELTGEVPALPEKASDDGTPDKA